MSVEEPSGIIKVATNEYALLGNRIFVSGCAAVLVFFASGIRDDTTTLKREFVAYQLSEEARLSRIEGTIKGMEGSIEVHRKRLEGNDNDIRSLWARIYDLASGRATPQRSTP